ncbi:MAG: RluA family pseudouridine synthase [Verrucomicrobiae bacterium]|nr:RluA family pseudouridine synthase [Verrucomicrobiae bacterium]
MPNLVSLFPTSSLLFPRNVRSLVLLPAPPCSSHCAFPLPWVVLRHFEPASGSRPHTASLLHFCPRLPTSPIMSAILPPSSPTVISPEALQPFARTRLDIALARITGRSRTWIQRQIKAGRLTTSEGVPLLSCAEPPPLHTTLHLAVPCDAAPSSAAMEEGETHNRLPDSAFLYEDDHLIVLNKPPGLVVHPASGHFRGTLSQLLLARYGPQSLSTRAGSDRPGIVHRLDAHTSGLLLIARHDHAHARLAAQFASRTVEKHYLAIVHGTLRHPQGRCEGPIGRHPTQRKKMAVLPGAGRPALTDYRLLHQSPQAALLLCRPHTGRTHQIRVHLAHLGHPILGDALYAGRRAQLPDLPPIPRQMLHAYRLAFDHPADSRRLTFTASPPEDFANLAYDLQIPLNTILERPHPE